MKTTQSPNVRSLGVRRVSRHEQGMILIMVIVVLVLLAVMATAALQVARVDRMANHRFTTDNIDTVAAATIAQIQKTLVDDLFDANGKLFNHEQPNPANPSDPNKGGARAPYDYPWTNNSVTGNFLWPNATGGYFDDMWLSSTAPDFTTPANPVWSHLTNLNGVFLDLPAAGGVDIEERVVDNASPDTSDTNISVLGLLNQAFNASYLPRGADADSDGIVDSRWTYAPIRTIGGVSYYIAVRIVDNSSLANANVWTSLINNTGAYDTTNAGDHAPRGSYPSELNLGRFVLNAYSTPATSPAIARMTELEKLLRWRYTGNPSDAVQVLPTRWSDTAQLTHSREPWSMFFGTNSYLLNPRTRGHSYLYGTALWNGTSSIRGAAGAFVFSYRNLPMSDEMDLRYKNGLVDPAVATTIGSLTNGMHYYMRKDQPAEGLYTDFTQKVSGGSAVPNAANIKLFFEENPRTQITVRSGASVYAPRLPDYTGLAVTHNNISLTSGANPTMNDPAMPIKLDINALSFTPAIVNAAGTVVDTQLENRRKFEFAPTWNGATPPTYPTITPNNNYIQVRHTDAQTRAMTALSNEIRRVIERGNFRLPWRTGTAPIALEKERFANSFTMNICNFYHEVDGATTQDRPIVTGVLGQGDRAYGWRPLPMITEVYIQKAYSINTSTTPVDYTPIDNGNNTWRVQWGPQWRTQAASSPLTPFRAENGFIIEIRNPFPYAIDLRNIQIAANSGQTGLQFLVATTTTWGSRGPSWGANTMRPNDVIYLYYNAGNSGSANNNMTSRLPAPNPPTNSIHHVDMSLIPAALPIAQAFQPVAQPLNYTGETPKTIDSARFVNVNMLARHHPVNRYPVLTTTVPTTGNWPAVADSSVLRTYQSVSIQTFDDRPTPLNTAYVNSIYLTPGYTGNPATEPRLNPPQFGRLVEPAFFDPAFPSGTAPTAAVERYKCRTVLGNGNGLNALSVGQVGNLLYVVRSNFQQVAQAAPPTAYVPGIPMIPQGSLPPTLVSPLIPAIPVGGITPEKQIGEDNNASVPGGWGTPGGVGEDWVVSVGEIAPAVAMGSLNTPAGGWGAWPLGYIPGGFYGPGNPPASIYPDPPADIPPSPPTAILPVPPTYQPPVPNIAIPEVPAVYAANPPADIPAVPAIPEGVFIQNVEPPFPLEPNLSSFGTKDKTTAAAAYSVGMHAPHYLAKLPASMPPGQGGNASSLLANQQLVFHPPLNGSRFNRLGSVGQISMVAALPWLGEGTTVYLNDVWSSAHNASTNPITSIEQFMLDFRSPRFVGGTTHDGNLAVPHATFLIDRLTTLSPLRDGQDNDGDGVTDPGDTDNDGRLDANATAAELLVPGLLNINTVPPHILRRALPIPTTSGNTVVLDSVVDTLINYRDMKSNFSAQDRGVAPGFRTKGGAGLKGIAYIGELFGAFSMLSAGDPANIGNNFDGGGVAIDDVDILGTVIDWWGPDVSQRKTVTDGIANDRKERMMIPAMLSGLLSTRSDIYTAYILVQGFPTGDFTNAVETARLYVVLDRSACTPSNRAARIIGIYKY